MLTENMHSLWRIDIIKVLILLIHKHHISLYWLRSFKIINSNISYFFHTNVGLQLFLSSLWSVVWLGKFSKIIQLLHDRPVIWTYVRGQQIEVVKREHNVHWQLLLVISYINSSIRNSEVSIIWHSPNQPEVAFTTSKRIPPLESDLSVYCCT